LPTLVNAPQMTLFLSKIEKKGGRNLVKGTLINEALDKGWIKPESYTSKGFPQYSVKQIAFLVYITENWDGGRNLTGPLASEINEVIEEVYKQRQEKAQEDN
jgi:hypothetical protein